MTGSDVGVVIISTIFLKGINFSKIKSFLLKVLIGLILYQVGQYSLCYPLGFTRTAIIYAIHKHVSSYIHKHLSINTILTHNIPTSFGRILLEIHDFTE